MNDDLKTPVNRDAKFDSFAAELALAAYRVALRTRTQGTWLDLELDLWRALAATAKTWGEGIVELPVAGDAACTVPGAMAWRPPGLAGHRGGPV